MYNIWQNTKKDGENPHVNLFIFPIKIIFNLFTFAIFIINLFSDDYK